VRPSASSAASWAIVPRLRPMRPVGDAERAKSSAAPREAARMSTSPGWRASHSAARSRAFAEDEYVSSGISRNDPPTEAKPAPQRRDYKQPGRHMLVHGNRPDP
jgi:hypothetical protein